MTDEAMAVTCAGCCSTGIKVAVRRQVEEEVVGVQSREACQSVGERQAMDSRRVLMQYYCTGGQLVYLLGQRKWGGDRSDGLDRINHSVPPTGRCRGQGRGNI